MPRIAEGVGSPIERCRCTHSTYRIRGRLTPVKSHSRNDTSCHAINALRTSLKNIQGEIGHKVQSDSVRRIFIGILSKVANVDPAEIEALKMAQREISKPVPKPAPQAATDEEMFQKAVSSLGVSMTKYSDHQILLSVFWAEHSRALDFLNSEDPSDQTKSV
jgi:hypothetical protein